MTAAPRTALIVLGMHRSGTSAMSGVLHHAGFELGPDISPPGEDNPKGYFENRFITDCNDEILRALGSSWDDPVPLGPERLEAEALGPVREKIVTYFRQNFADNRLIGLKDPRICVLLPIWKSILSELGFTIRSVVMLRNPAEVAASLQKRNGFTREKSFVLWMKYALAAELESRSFPRAFVFFDTLLRDPATVLASLSAAFGVPLKDTALVSGADNTPLLDASLKHHTLESGCAPYALPDACFTALSRLAANDTPAEYSAIDSLRMEYQTIAGLFYHDEAKNLMRQELDLEGLREELSQAQAQLAAIRTSRGWLTLTRYYRLKNILLGRADSGDFQ